MSMSAGLNPKPRSPSSTEVMSRLRMPKDLNVAAFAPASTGGTLAEALNGALPVIMHMALSWLVLQAFLRGELYWLFVAIFVHAVVEIMATLLGPNDAWIVVAWRVLVAVGSMAAIVRVRGPGLSAERE